MSQENQHDDRQVKAADVKRGDFTYDSKSGAPVEVTHVQPVTRRVTDFVLIVTDDGDAGEHAADDLIWIVSATNLATARAHRERKDRITAIRSFVDWLEDNPNVPLPDVPSMQHSMVIGTDERKRSVAATVAALLGVDLEEGPDGSLSVRKPVVQRDAYRSIDYVWHATVTPRPVEPQSIEDVAPRGTDAAEGHTPKPADVAGYGHARGGNGFTEEPPSELTFTSTSEHDGALRRWDLTGPAGTASFVVAEAMGIQSVSAFLRPPAGSEAETDTFVGGLARELHRDYLVAGDEQVIRTQLEHWYGERLAAEPEPSARYVDAEAERAGFAVQAAETERGGA